MAQPLTGLISLQPGTWNVQIALPEVWVDVGFEFRFDNGDAAHVEISGSPVPGSLDSVVVEWANHHDQPIRVDYRIFDNLAA